MRKALLIPVTILLLTIPLTIYAQENSKRYNYHITFGANVNLYSGKPQYFPGFKLFAGFAASVYNGNFFGNYGANIGMYYKTLGTSLNPLINDIQVDFTNSFTAGFVYGDISYQKYIRTVQNSNFYNIYLGKEYGALISTNFIFNNHRRHQAVGSIALSAGQFSLNYSNDGGPGISTLLVGDGFDRWWTGSGALYLHSLQGYNYVELSFDQFTGHRPLIYELSDVLGIRIPNYNWRGRYVTGDSAITRLAFNTSEYRIKVNFNDISVEAGVIGSLRCNGRVYGVQDIIHILGKMPLHPNNDINRFFIGSSYNKNINAKF